MALGVTRKMAGHEHEVIPPSDSEEYVIPNLNNNIHNYDPPSSPSDNNSEGISDDSNLATNEHDETDGPNSYGLPETPIVNYFGDYEDQDDYFDGWIWNCFPGQEDSEPECGPFLGKEQLLFDIRRNELFHFFNELFLPTMFNEIADSTNRYTAQRLNRTSEYIYYYQKSYTFSLSKNFILLLINIT